MLEQLKAYKVHAILVLVALGVGATFGSLATKKNIEERYSKLVEETSQSVRTKTTTEITERFEKEREQIKQAYEKSLSENTRTVEKIVEKPGGERVVERVVERSVKSEEKKEASSEKTSEKASTEVAKKEETQVKVVEKKVVETVEKKVETSIYPSWTIGALAGVDGTPLKDKDPKLQYGLKVDKHFGPLSFGVYGLLKHEDKRLGVGAAVSWSL